MLPQRVFTCAHLRGIASFSIGCFVFEQRVATQGGALQIAGCDNLRITNHLHLSQSVGTKLVLSSAEPDARGTESQRGRKARQAYSVLRKT